MTALTQRDAFWNGVYEEALRDENVVIVSADMAAPALDKFRRRLPHQFINVGIAEQNAILVAAGMALEGKKPYAYAIAPFITYRCYEQIRLYCAGMNLPITVVGVGAGFSYDDSGPTHHTLEDISIMRVLPHLRVYNMTDSVMAGAFAGITRRQAHSSYIRLDRQVLPALYRPDDDFSAGLRRFRPGKDLLIIATGNMVHCALKLAQDLESRGVEAGVLDVYGFPIAPEILAREMGEVPRAVTLAEHTLPGGLGSAVLETLETAGLVLPVKRLGLDLSCGYCYQYGGRENIQRLHNLHHPGNLEQILAWIKG